MTTQAVPLLPSPSSPLSPLFASCFFAHLQSLLFCLCLFHFRPLLFIFISAAILAFLHLLIFSLILFSFLTGAHIKPLDIPAHRSPSQVPLVPPSFHPTAHSLLFKSYPSIPPPCPFHAPSMPPPCPPPLARDAPSAGELSRCSEWRPLLYRIRLPVSGGLPASQGAFQASWDFSGGRGREGGNLLSWGETSLYLHPTELLRPLSKDILHFWSSNMS